MAGLLGEGFDDPRSAAIMALSAGLLRKDFGAGLLGANAAYSNSKADALKSQMVQMEMEQRRMGLAKARREDAQEQGLLGLQSQFFQPGSAGFGGTAEVNDALPAQFQIGAQAPVPARAAQFDINGYTQAAMNQKLMNPLEALKLRQAMGKESQINKLDVKDFDPASVQKYAQTGNYADLVRRDKLHFGDTGGALVGMDPFTGKPVGSVPKSGNPFSDLIVSDGAGGFRQNSPLIGAKRDIARAGASSVNVNADNLGLKPKDRFEMEDKLRNDYTKATTADQEIISTAADIRNILSQPGALKDQAAIYKFAKALDPQGAVREADYAAIVKTAGGLDYVTALVTKAINGEQLSPKQRKEMGDLSASMASVAQNRLNKQQATYASRAKMYNLAPENVFSPAAAADEWSIVPRAGK